MPATTSQALDALAGTALLPGRKYVREAEMTSTWWAVSRTPPLGPVTVKVAWPVKVSVSSQLLALSYSAAGWAPRRSPLVNENSWEKPSLEKLEGHIGGLVGHGGQVIGRRNGVVAGLARQRLCLFPDKKVRHDRTAGAGEAESEKDLAWGGSCRCFARAELAGEAVADDPGREAVAVDPAVLRLSEASGRTCQELGHADARRGLSGGRRKGFDKNGSYGQRATQKTPPPARHAKGEPFGCLRQQSPKMGWLGPPPVHGRVPAGCPRSGSGPFTFNLGRPASASGHRQHPASGRAS